MLPRHTPGNVWSVRPVVCGDPDEEDKMVSVMSVTVDTTPSVLASPVYPQVGTEIC